MTRPLILGTAGHIDHGKTALVRALTGTDTDRLPEEKARGITIDIGFARLDLGDLTLGVIDVPGHERFVRNMLAGATGVDLAMLVVAADDAVMPQTREHLDILQLLGLEHGVIVVTKADLVGADARGLVEAEVRELVRGTFLENVPIVATSTHTGEGIDELKSVLRCAASCCRERAVGLPFRLPIDRAFVAQGFGTVVTGSVASGGVRVGDELDWHRGDGSVEKVRVRGLNRHGDAAEAVERGQRAAINLAGVPHEQVRRGQELAAVGYLSPGRVLSVRLRAVGKAIRHRLPVRVHVGTAEVMGTASVLDFDRVEPGTPALAQLFLDEPVVCVHGQPFVVRDSSAEHTLGGGLILQPTAVKLRRRHLDSLAKLEAMESPDPAVRVATAGWFAGFTGLTPDELPRSAGVPPADVPALLDRLTAAGSLVALRKALLHAERVTELEDRLLAALAELHAANPLMTTHDRQPLAARFGYAADDALIQAVLDRMLKAKKLVGDKCRVARADFQPKLTANQRKLKDKIVEQHRLAGLSPPDPSSFANQAAGNAASLTDIYEVAVAEGFLVKVSADVFLSPDADAELRRRVSERLDAGPGLTVADIRDLLGITRKHAVPFCEYLDRVGVTRRAGDVRVRAS